MRTHVDSPADNYWPEPCAACKGTGKYQFNVDTLAEPLRESVVQQSAEYRPNCMACAGKALVLVLQPARKCRHCAGTGRVLKMRCARCNGTGWMFVQTEPAALL